MKFSFYLGRSGSGKTTQFLEEIQSTISQAPIDGPPILYLVPEQMTFQVENQLVMMNGGMTRGHVLSFSRLALRVMQEVGGSARGRLQRAGTHMLLRKIMEEEKNNFRIFSKASDAPGFLEKIEELITEMRRQALTPDLFKEKTTEISEKTSELPSVQTMDKLHDIGIIFERFEEAFQGTYMNTEESLKLLVQQIPEAKSLENATIYIDGFHDFSRQELEVIQALSPLASKIKIALTLDRIPSIDEPLNELNRFYLTARTYMKLIMPLQNAGYRWNVKHFTPGKRYNHPVLRQLEDDKHGNPVQAASAIEIYEAGNRRAEVEGIARRVLGLVRDEGYRFQDIAVLVREHGPYADLLKQVFSDYDIPLFLDEKRSMMHHPVIEMIRSSLEIIEKNWPYEAVFRALKTDLFFSADEDWDRWRERVDELENYVLAHGTSGQQWKNKKNWVYSRFRNLTDKPAVQTNAELEIERRLNDTRRALIAPLLTLENRFMRARSVADRCYALYLFLEELRVPEKLEKIGNDFRESGNLESARENDQVWDTILELLDQFVDVAGTEHLSLQHFRRMVESGLESMQFAIVPPAIDQVTVADMERSRISNIRCTFILGSNEGILPSRPEEDGLVNDHERALLTDAGLEFGPSATERLWHEPFYIYLAEASPSDRLIYTYACADEDGKTLLPSPLIQRVQERFQDIPLQVWPLSSTEAEEHEQLSFISQPAQALQQLARHLQRWRDEEKLPPLWWSVYNWFVDQPDWHNRLRIVLGSLFYKNESAPLQKQTVSQLYGEEIQASVSRMELFQACAFRHFSVHGLKLREREVFKLEAPDIGEFFHAALKEVSARIGHQQQTWESLSDAECEAVAEEAVQQILPLIQRNIMLSSNRHAYLGKKLTEVISQTTKIMKKQAQSSRFVPIGLEVGFGPGNHELPPLRFRLSNGKEMTLIGRIDRVDRAKSANGPLLRIIDYKSSEQKLELSDVYHGLSLQMPVYLDIVLSGSKQWLDEEADIGGMFYFHVHNPVVNATENISNSEIEQMIFKKFKLSGWLPENLEIATSMDEALESEGHSAIIPAAITKKGSFHKKASVINLDAFNELRGYLHESIRKIGETMTEGKIHIHPAKTKSHVACTFCPFESVCQFDPTLPGHSFNHLPTISKDDALTKMTKKKEEEK